MQNRYLEKIVCGKCGKEHIREMEIFETSKMEMDQPLKAIIIKKFKCDNCDENKNYTIKIIDNETSII